MGSRLINNLIMELERTHNGRVEIGALQRCEPGSHGVGSSYGASCHIHFDRLLYVGPPNEADGEAILKIHLRTIPCSSAICLKELASVTKGYTGADISLTCRGAAIAALEVNFFFSFHQFNIFLSGKSRINLGVPGTLFNQSRES